MKIENTQVFGFQASIRACRNPWDSWDKSDSTVNTNDYNNTDNANIEHFILGNLDKKLSQSLCKSGTEHCKHLRMIQVWGDFNLPRYIWQEFDTYKNIEKISCSTTHTLMKKEIEYEMFEDGENYIDNIIINLLNGYIEKYKNASTKEDKKLYKYWTKTILPESFLQKRTINTNYQTLLNMYKQRKNHPLPQWGIICNWILELPYFKELTGI